MSLTPEQQQTVASWIAAGDSLSDVQKKLSEQFKLSLTYRDVRFLVDDLDLSLKDATPKVDASDVSKAQPSRPAAPATPPAAEKKGFFDKAKEKLGLGKNEDAAGPDEAGDEAELTNDAADELPADATGVQITVDNVTLIPGAVASGTVTFSDGVTGKWLIDQYGRPGFTEISRPGYRPSPTDAQAFMEQLTRALQQRGY